MNHQSAKRLYKYYAPGTGINHVLSNGTIKWSTPFEFNDPFDNQFEIHLQDVHDGLIDELLDEFLKSDFSSVEIKVGEMVISGAAFGNALKKLKPHITSQERAEMRDGIIEGIRKANEYLPAFKMEFMADGKLNSIRTNNK